MVAAKPKIALVISCGRRTGMGHLYRSLRLARVLSSSYHIEPEFFLSDAECIALVEGYKAYPISQIETSDAQIALIDGIAFTARYIDSLKNIFAKRVVIDDLGERRNPVDIILNPNLFAKQLDYSFQTDGKLLLGVEYALIDPGFGAIRARKRDVHRVLITFGGGSSAKLSFKVAAELGVYFAGDIDVALGAFEPRNERPMPPNVHLHANADMPALMARSTVYVGSLGTSYLEARAAGLICITSPIVDNQKPVIEPALRFGDVVVVPFDAKRLASAAKRVLKGPIKTLGESNIDGMGIARAAKEIAALF